MIVLAWSLVSSVIEAARRRRLAIYLRQFLDDADNTGTMLLCRKIKPFFSSSVSQLARFTSDSQLNNHQTLYRNEGTEVVIQAAQPIGFSEWRFVPYAVSDVRDLRVYFIAYSSQFQSTGNCQMSATELSGCTVFLESCCDRVAWHHLKPASIYSCPFDRFFDIVYAFSEGALYENNTNTLIDCLHTISLSDIELSNYVASSFLGNSRTQIAQRPLPLLEQLFWGDKNAWSALRERFSSESALLQIQHGSLGSLPRRYYTSSRRRYRSYTYDSVHTCRNRHTISLSSAPKFFAPTELPPFIRFLEYSSRPSSARSFMDQISKKSQRNFREDMVLSSSVTIDELDRKSDLPDLRSDVEIPYVDDSDTTTSSQPIIEGSKYAAVIMRQKDSFNSDALMNYANDDDKVEFKRVTEIVTDNEEWKFAERPPLPHCAQNRINTRQHKACGNNGEEWSQVHNISRRRHSVVVSPVSCSTTGEQSTRYRSLSPVPHEFFRRRSIHTSLESSLMDRSIFARDPFPRPYTPTRRFHAHNNQSPKAMYKPSSILVYTGNHAQLYSRIRESLSRIIPFDRYTVFNISLEAIRKQPWIETTTACLVIADTSDLDDLAWTKMQTYFNQAGKIIFVCQNRLLASLTNCDSMKKQADILRMAFGSRDSISMGKDFEHFLKKSLKSLTKQGQVNETFHSKDLAGGMSYSVVLTKTSDLPLLLYMENSAHQASAIFSDATSEQLLAPGSRILFDSLSRVGVSVCESACPSLTMGILVAIEDRIINDMMGIRYGEEIGQNPKLFLRRRERVAEQGMPHPTRGLLPVEIQSRHVCCCSESGNCRSFNIMHYFSRLTTQRLGKVLLYVPVTTTTMDISSSLCDAIPTCEGAVVVAGQQISGQGRGGNEFVSPVGAAMFTVAATLPQSSALAHNPAFIQHIFAVSLVDAVHRLSGIKDFPLRIKWPNDFYFNRSHKVGGVLATAKCRDDGLLITVGAGINVTNSQPTICLNDMVPNDSNIKFKIEEIIAETLNRFEYWMNSYEIKGSSEVLSKYYEFWLHSREEVLLEELSEKVLIRGLDKYGYLQVRSKSNPSKLFSVADNGNTFDMMKGLIRQKII